MTGGLFIAHAALILKVQAHGLFPLRLAAGPYRRALAPCNGYLDLKTPTRRMRAANRGSERSGSSRGLTLSDSIVRVRSS